LDKIEKALQFQSEKFSCSQCIVAAFSDKLGIDEKTALKIAAPFGGGMANQGNICGALTGAYMVIGLKYGRVIGTDDASKAKTYEVMNRANEFFMKEFGAINCSELLGEDVSIAGNRDMLKEEGVYAEKCPNFVRKAAEFIIKEVL